MVGGDGRIPSSHVVSGSAALGRRYYGSSTGGVVDRAAPSRIAGGAGGDHTARIAVGGRSAPPRRGKDRNPPRRSGIHWGWHPGGELAAKGRHLQRQIRRNLPHSR